jgi:hypothetical protein
MSYNENEYNSIISVGVDVYDEEFRKEMNKGLQPEFKTIREVDIVRTQEQQEPVFYDIEVCVIHNAADPNSKAVHPVDREIKRRFPKEYAEWKMSGVGLTEVGTPLRRWPIMIPDLLPLYEAFNIRTVEMLAEINEAMIPRLEKGRELRAKAISWLEVNKDAEANAKRLLENEELKARISQLESMMTEKRKPGRPPNLAPSDEVAA